MDFTLTPEAGLPRLIRFTAIETPPIVALLDPTTNVLLVDKELYEQLDPVDKQRVITNRHEWMEARIEPGAPTKLLFGDTKELAA